jgi:hypothetical protein
VEAALNGCAISSRTDEDFILLIAWLLAVLRGTGPYPVLTVIGEQGLAKSTLLEVVRLLVDPNQAGLRTPPRDTRDLFIAANNAHVLAFDNLSNLPTWLSSDLARISTGSAFTTRELYTNAEEKILDAVNPIALNGITDIVTHPDLASRCTFVTAERIPAEYRKPKEDLLAAFELERAQILGALLDAVAQGIVNLPMTNGHWPRMADFAKWATACEPAFTKRGSFNAAYERNRTEALESLLEDNLLADAIGELRLPWEGRATELLERLNAVTGHAHVSAKDWPKDGKALSGRLCRLAPLLLEKGINAEKLRRTSAKRGWSLTPISADKADLPSSASSASTARVACIDVTGAVICNQQTVKGNDDGDVSDDQSADLSARQQTTCVLSDMDAAYQELRIRDDAAGPPARQFRRRKRTSLRPR